MNHTSKNMEHSGVESNVNYDNLVQEVLEENICQWPRDCLFDILVKNVAAFCLGSRILSEAKLKSFGSMALVEEISRLPSIDSVTWLLVITLTQIYDEKE